MVPSVWDVVNKLMPAVIFVAVLMVGVILDFFVLRFLRRLARRTTTELDDLLLRSVNRIILLSSFLIAAYLSVNGTHLAALFPARILKLFNSGILVALMMTVAWVISVIVGYLIDSYVRTLPQEVPTGIIKSIVKVIFLSIALLMGLESSGISVTPILTALGVGGLAVALALQDSLGNLFAGINVTFSGQVRKGDFVKLENGEEGFVEDITWRNTLVRTLANNIVIVPNSKLASSILVNYDLIDRPRGVPIRLGVSYSSDLEKVERITMEVARGVQREITEEVATRELERLKNLARSSTKPREKQKLEEEIETFRKLAESVKKWEPIFRYTEFGDSSINFVIILRALTAGAVFLLRHEFVKRIKKRYDMEGIEIPFPQRDIWFRNFPQG